MKNLITLLSILALSIGLSACNTVKGFGKDVERGGEKMQGAATDVQKGNSSSGSSSGSYSPAR